VGNVFLLPTICHVFLAGNAFLLPTICHVFLAGNAFLLPTICHVFLAGNAFLLLTIFGYGGQQKDLAHPTLATLALSTSIFMVGNKRNHGREACTYQRHKLSFFDLSILK